jgi:hypothetical protein
MKLGSQIAILCFAAASLSAAQPPSPYSAVEIDRFVPNRGVTFSPNDQSALVDDIAREVSLLFETVIILRQDDAAPSGRAVLRISGTVIQFKPGNRTKRSLLGFGGGAVLEVLVNFSDAATRQVLLSREINGGSDSLAKKIAKFCNSAHLVASN